jgi:predicted ATP-grasp superfamily ATP-dependent carboligase
VLDSNQRSALAVTRSLGRHSFLHIFNADESWAALAGQSRYSSRYCRCPSPASEPQTFLQWLREFVATEAIDWVFPVTEISSQLILATPSALGSARLPFAEFETVMALTDKSALVSLARKLDVPHPNSQYFPNAAAFFNSTENGVAAYPIVIKPCVSRLRLGDYWLNTSVHIARSSTELDRLLQEKVYLREHAFMLQEFIPGTGAGIFALYNNGNPVTFFAHRRLREKPPGGGVSVLSESAPPPPDMLAMAKKLLDAVHWHGVAMVEFRVTPDGTPYLMEVNTRFWGSLQLAVDAGVDFPYWLYQVCNGETPAPAPYRNGRRLRWLLGDIDSLYLMLRDRHFTTAQKLQRVLDFLTPHPFSTRHEVNRLDDLGPAWFELKQYIRALRG